MQVFMGLSGQGNEDGNSSLLGAIGRAVAAVDPLLKETAGYPDVFVKPVATAVEYVHWLAASLPGPVDVDAKSPGTDSLASSLFPSADDIHDGLCASQALLDYHRKFPASRELFALMGMRRTWKPTASTDLSGQGRSGPVLFSSHTIDGAAPTEQMSRDMAALNFFDSLVTKVKLRIAQRRKELQSEIREMELLANLMGSANSSKLPALEQELERLQRSTQAIRSSLEVTSYVDDFEAVMLHPEEYLHIVQTPFSMGARPDGHNSMGDDEHMLNELIGYDRRDWTVTMVRCSDVLCEPYLGRTGGARRKLAFDSRVYPN